MEYFEKEVNEFVLKFLNIFSKIPQVLSANALILFDLVE